MRAFLLYYLMVKGKQQENKGVQEKEEGLIHLNNYVLLQ